MNVFLNHPTNSTQKSLFSCKLQIILILMCPLLFSFHRWGGKDKVICHNLYNRVTEHTEIRKTKHESWRVRVYFFVLWNFFQCVPSSFLLKKINTSLTKHELKCDVCCFWFYWCLGKEFLALVGKLWRDFFLKVCNVFPVLKQHLILIYPANVTHQTHKNYTHSHT